jgi:hypothetical protein
MKLKDIKGFPKKRKMSRNKFLDVSGFNQAHEEIGNLEISLDVGKVYKMIKEYIDNDDSGFHHNIAEHTLEDLAQSLADRFGEIVK